MRKIMLPVTIQNQLSSYSTIFLLLRHRRRMSRLRHQSQTLMNRRKTKTMIAT
ncbi:hypothetical protein FWH09_03315 [Candidatus Saccharibacteria bacterium]|nr:hypothetical protein [Candidatus Saccharibacteria bacterium]